MRTSSTIMVEIKAKQSNDEKEKRARPVAIEVTRASAVKQGSNEQHQHRDQGRAGKLAQRYGRYET